MSDSLPPPPFRRSGWLEILGSGMVDPAVFASVGYNPDEVSGFAFGLGVGIGFDLFQMVRIKVGYDWGLLDVNKTDAVTTNNSMLHAGVAFLF